MGAAKTNLGQSNMPFQSQKRRQNETRLRGEWVVFGVELSSRVVD